VTHCSGVGGEPEVENREERASNNPLGEGKQRLVPSEYRKGRKTRFTLRISEELLEEIRDVAVALSGPPNRLTLSDLAGSALRREVDRLKRLYRSGKEFAKRDRFLRRVACRSRSRRRC